MKRRSFLKNMAVGSLLANVPLSFAFSKESSFAKAPVPKRKLANTGEKLSVIGFGGIMLNENGQKFANETVSRAVDEGVNYFDVAPTYGNAESLLGPALKPYRKDSFLACKSGEFSREKAEEELHNSLKLLQTDHFDLYQLHALSSMEDLEQAFGPNGSMELFEKAKKEGKIRLIGFSAHNEEVALKAMDMYDFDTILFPLNFGGWYQGNFGPRAYKKAKEKNMGILALKSMAERRLAEGQDKLYKNIWYRPVEDMDISQKAFRFTLSKDITAAIPPGDSKFFFRAAEHARNFKKLTLEEDRELQRIAHEMNRPIFQTA